MSAIAIAVVVLVVSLDRNSGFFENMGIVKSAKEGVIIYSQIRTMFVTLINIKNSN